METADLTLTLYRHTDHWRQVQSQFKGTDNTRKVQRRNPDIQQKTTPDVMDFKSETDGHAADFYLSYLEEQVRSELGDSTAKITQTTQGRVCIDLQEDLLEEFLNELHAPKGITKNWSQERKDMRREMHGLKAQLKEAQAKCDLVSEENADDGAVVHDAIIWTGNVP